MKIVLLYLREFFALDSRTNFKNNLTKILEHFWMDSKEDLLIFAKSMSYVYSLLLSAKTSFLVPKYNNLRTYTNYSLIYFKISSTIELLNIIDWNDDILIRILPFICCICPRTHYQEEIEELEVDDLNLLRLKKHPFQLLQNKPTILLLAYIPTSLQNLYIQLFKQKQISVEDDRSDLPYLHLLITFLLVILEMDHYSIRFSVLLTIVLSTIIHYKMENFILIFADKDCLNTSYSRYYKKHFSTAYNQNYCRPFMNIIRIVEQKEQIKSNKQAIIDEEYRMKNAQNDLQLYAACCCVAKLLQENSYLYSDKEIIKTKYNELWEAINMIKQPLWKLDAAIHIFSTLLPLSSRHHYTLRVITWLEEFEPTIPLLSYVALFIRCIYIIHKNRYFEEKLFSKILKRLKTVTIIEQQAICEALMSISYFQYDISQYIYQSQSLENVITLREIFDGNITIFVKYLLLKIFSSTEMKVLGSTLLVSMYLSGLITYIAFLDDSRNKETYFNSSKNLSSQVLFKRCLKALEEYPEHILTEKAVATISTFLSLPISQIETKQIHQINQNLVKRRIIDKAARSIVFKWIKYRYDQLLYPFAYHAALILTSSDMWTSTIIEIRCELSISKNDCFRENAVPLLNCRKWRFNKKNKKMILNYFRQWNEKEIRWISQIEHFFGTITIQTIKEMKEIIKLERERFKKIIENQSITFDKMNNYSCGTSFFRLIQNISPEVEEYIITILQTLSTCVSDSKEFLFFQWFLQEISIEFSNDCEDFLNFLIDLLLNSHHFNLKITAARSLIHFRNYEEVENILWNIAMNIVQNNSDELIAACIWSLCTDEEIRDFAQENFEKLDSIRQHSNSSLICHVISAKMYRFIMLEPEKYNIFEVYYSYMSNINNLSGYDKVKCLDKTSNWIIKYASILLSQFIDDIYQTVDKKSYFDISACVEVAADICEKIPNEFRVAVRQSQIGEKNFRKCLFEICKNVCNFEQEACLKVYACFEDASPHYVQMYLEIMLYKHQYLFKDLKYVTTLRFVSERQSIELLFDNLQNSFSLKQRYYAAKLLVHLTLLDQVSTIDVQNLLVKAIDDPSLQQFLDEYDSSSRLDNKLKLLLTRLLIKEEDNNVQPIKNIDRVNQNTHCRIPAVILKISDR